MKSLVCSLLLATALTSYAFQAPAPAKSTPSAKAAMKPAPAAAPTDAEIAEAKAKGLVWVNTSTKVFHSGGDFYGKTKQGKFMTADEATKAGFRAAKEPAPPKSKKAKATDGKK